MAGRKTKTTELSQATGAHEVVGDPNATASARAENRKDSKATAGIEARRTQDVDRAALREDIMKRFPTIRAALAK